MSKKAPEYEVRFDRHYDELRTLYEQLYPGCAGELDDLCEKMRHAYRLRGDDLKQLDRAREADPAWYRGNDQYGMMLYVGPFAGNLRGVQSKLDYLQECGVNYLHLMPLLESPEGRSDGGYAVSDFRTVQPELGTMEDLEALTADCHGRGMSVCLDFVMNHTSEEHEWARRARAGEEEYQDRYFFYDDWEIPEAYEKTVPQVFPIGAPGNFTWLEDCQKVVMTTFYPYQWDLNYRNPVVFNEMMDNMLYLANQGVDVVRIDAVPYIWKELGTNCRNLPQVHTIVRMARIITEIVCPGVLLLGEVVMEPAKVAPYFGTPERPECHILYNVTTMCTTWSTVATRDTRLLYHQLDQVAALPKQYLFQNYLRCHDDIGWGLDYPWLRQFAIDEVAHKKFLNDYFTGKVPFSTARGELYNDDPRLGDARLCGTTASLCGLESALEADSPERVDLALKLDEMLHAFVFTQSGIPVLYAGDEVAQLNDNSYHDDPAKADDSRYIHRGNFQWDRAEARTDRSTPQGRLFQALRHLARCRSAHHVFDADADFWTVFAGDQSILGLGRYKDGFKLYGLYNFSPDRKPGWLEEQGTYLNLVTGETVEISGAVPMEGYDFVWLLRQY